LVVNWLQLHEKLHVDVPYLQHCVGLRYEEFATHYRSYTRDILGMVGLELDDSVFEEGASASHEHDQDTDKRHRRSRRALLDFHGKRLEDSVHVSRFPAFRLPNRIHDQTCMYVALVRLDFHDTRALYMHMNYNTLMLSQSQHMVMERRVADTDI